NAVEHAFAVPPGSGDGPDGEDGRPGRVVVGLDHRGDRLAVTVGDDGIGMPPGFDIEMTTSLGLSIVRDLVLSQLGGSIMTGVAGGGGTKVMIEVPTGGAER
ncbi:MAG: ATP-binding protein, partial [Acidimicrobiales bacterium]